MPPRTVDEWNKAASNFRLLPVDAAEIVFLALFGVENPGCVAVPIIPKPDARRSNPLPFQVWRKWIRGDEFEYRHVISRKNRLVIYTVGSRWEEGSLRRENTVDEWIDWAWNAEVIREDK